MMSFENDGLPVSWEDIKAASRRLDRREDEVKVEKRVVREYLAHTDCEDARVKEHGDPRLQLITRRPIDGRGRNRFGAAVRRPGRHAAGSVLSA
jgi:hypothetical protein